MESEGLLPRLQQPISCPARKPDQSTTQTPSHFVWVRREILKRSDWILEINNFYHWYVGGMYFRTRNYETHLHVVDCVWNVMALAQKPDFIFLRNGRVHLNRRGCQFSRLLAALVCASAVVMLGTPCSEVVWRVLATHSIHQFLLHFLSRASPCAITFQLDSTQGYDQIYAPIPYISAFTSGGFRARLGQQNTTLSTDEPTHTVFR